MYIIEDITKAILCSSDTLEGLARQMCDRGVFWDGNIVCAWKKEGDITYYLTYSERMKLKEIYLRMRNND